jgi:hypothetical protein
MERTKIFVSYSHRDRKWLDRLKVHLALLERKDTLHIWSDTRIDIGERWQEEIENALEAVSNNPQAGRLNVTTELTNIQTHWLRSHM